MISSWHNLDRIGVAFDENHAVANAGLLPATLAQMLGLRELVDRQVGRGDAPGRTNAGLKVMTVVAAMLAETAGVDVLRAGAIQTVLGHLVRAPASAATSASSTRCRWPGHRPARHRNGTGADPRARAGGHGPGPRPAVGSAPQGPASERAFVVAGGGLRPPSRPPKPRRGRSEVAGPQGHSRRRPGGSPQWGWLRARRWLDQAGHSGHRSQGKYFRTITMPSLSSLGAAAANSVGDQSAHRPRPSRRRPGSARSDRCRKTGSPPYSGR